MVSDNMIGKIFLFFCLFSVPILNIQAQTTAAPGQIRPALQILDSTKEQDGLIGSVRRVKTEYAKITIKEGNPLEGPRQLLEVTTYGVKGNRVENVSYPINDSAVGREEYKYDDHGNIIEKVLRDERGAVLSREAYDYVFDNVGNWTKMVTSLVVIENGELKREPTEVTYRTLTYYAGESVPRTTARATETAPLKTLPESDAARSDKSVETVANGQPTANPTKVVEVQTPPAPAVETPEKKDEPVNGHAAGSTSQPAIDAPTVSTVAPSPETGSTGANGTAEKSLRIKQESPETSDLKSNTSTTIGESSGATRPSENLNSSSSVSAVPAATAKAEAVSAESFTSLTKALEFYRLGRQRFEAGDVSAAITAYLESVRLEPSSAEIHLNLGHAYLTSKKDKDAAKAFKEAVRLNPELSEAHYGLGFVSFRLNRYKDAMEAFKKATELKPDMAKAHYGLALAYQELGKLDLLVQQQRLLQRLDPKLANRLVQAFTDVDFSCRGGASRYCN